MENYVAAQLRDLVSSMALGAAAALIYDLLRSARLLDRRDKVLTHLLDGLFVVALAVLALFLGLYLGEGHLRLFMLTGAALGAVVWFYLFSPLLRPVWDFWCASLVAMCHLLAKPVRFTLKILEKWLTATKKGFSFLLAWGRMKCTPPAEKGAPMSKTTKSKKRKKTSPLLFLVLAVLIVVLAVQVVNVYGDLSDARAQESALSDALTEQQEANDALKADLEKKDDTNFIKALARELLGLAEEGERIFYDVNE